MIKQAYLHALIAGLMIVLLGLTAYTVLGSIRITMDTNTMYYGIVVMIAMVLFVMAFVAVGGKG